MPTLICVTDEHEGRQFCHTECGPADCNPDSECGPTYICNPNCIPSEK
jgi:hypothetical protein